MEEEHAGEDEFAGGACAGGEGLAAVDDAGGADGLGDAGGGWGAAGEVAGGKGDEVERHAGLCHEVIKEHIFRVGAGGPAPDDVTLADVFEAPPHGVEGDAEAAGTGEEGAGSLGRDKVGLGQVGGYGFAGQQQAQVVAEHIGIKLEDVGDAVGFHDGLHEAEHGGDGLEVKRGGGQAGAGGHTVQHDGHSMAALGHLSTAGEVVVHGYENAGAGLNLLQARHADGEGGFIFFSAKIEVEHFNV